jgi:hypothetical protein
MLMVSLSVKAQNEDSHVAKVVSGLSQLIKHKKSLVGAICAPRIRVYSRRWRDEAVPKKGKTMDLRKIFVVFSVALSLTTAMLTAQTYRGAIAGAVADSSGAAVADASVKIVHKGTGLTRTQNTPAAGDFNFADLPPGLYTVTVSRTGFQTFSEDVDAAVGKITSVPVTLGVAGQTQTVEVQAATVTLETNEAVLNAVVDTRAVAEIPLNARDFTQLLKLTPGYNDQGSMNGNRPNQNNWQIDGADNNDFWHLTSSIWRIRMGTLTTARVSA